MDAITEYQKWKQQGESLRMQAKQAMETRFRDMLLEAAQIAQEYHRDFGGALKPPASITTFRYKTAARKTAKRETPKAAPQSPKIADLHRIVMGRTRSLSLVIGTVRCTKVYRTVDLTPLNVAVRWTSRSIW